MLKIMTTGAIRFTLPEVMRERKIKQVELARKMGVHKQTVNRLVNGTRQLDLETLAKLCEALGVQPGDLLVYTPESESLADN